MTGYQYGASLTRDQIKDRRIAALEREAASLRNHNQRLRQRTTTQAELWPGDTPAICAARLEAAAAEADQLWADQRSTTRRAAA